MTSPRILKEAEIANPRGGRQNGPVFIMSGKREKIWCSCTCLERGFYIREMQ